MINLNTPKELFLKSCKNALNLQKEDGSMPSGHNGSYHDTETPIRNTAHWIISFSKAYTLTKEEVFFNAVKSALDFIKQDKWRPNNKTFYCRDKKGKDNCNGLIGQAWVIEGLIEGYHLLNDEEALTIASTIFKIHPFDSKRSIWKRVEPNGEILGFDFTFNHQLWFAMSGFLILSCKKDDIIEKQCKAFMENIPKNLKLHSNGRIGQSMKVSFKEDVLKFYAKKVLRKSQIEYMRLKEIGYHAFNTHAFSKISSLFPEIEFFKSKAYNKILKYLSFDEYQKGILISEYGFKYNPPGFEVLYTAIKNKKSSAIKDEVVSNLLEKQIEDHYDKENISFSLNVHDKNTSAARMYELSECF